MKEWIAFCQIHFSDTHITKEELFYCPIILQN